MANSKPTPEQNAVAFLREAADLIEGARAETYGPFLTNCETTLAYLVGRSLDPTAKIMYPEELVPQVQQGLKLGRLANEPTHHDSKVDLIAYLALEMGMLPQK